MDKKTLLSIGGIILAAYFLFPNENIKMGSNPTKKKKKKKKKKTKRKPGIEKTAIFKNLYKENISFGYSPSEAKRLAKLTLKQRGHFS